MADLFTVKTDLANAITFELQRQTIPVVRAKLRYAQFGQDGTIAPGTDRLRFIKLPDMPEDITNATLLPDEVTTVAIEALPVLTFVEVTTQEIGRVVGISRRARNLSPVDLVAHTRDTLGFDGARKIDALVRDEIANGGVVLYAGTATSRLTVGAAMTYTFGEARKQLVKIMALDLDDNTDMVSVTHPFAIGDLMSDTATGGWIQSNQYAGSKALFNGEVGSAYGIRFITTTRAKKYAGAGAGGIDVYASFVGLGPWAFGKARIEDLRFTAVPGTPDHKDPLGRQWLVGYYMDYGVKVLDATRYIRFESAATAV